MILNILNKYRDVGLLILRIGLGLMFMFHGLPKLLGGPEKWHGLGLAMQNLGIDFFPVFWGFMAAISEFLGGLLLVFGACFRIALGFLIITMTVAAVMHLTNGDGLQNASHAIELGIVFFSLLFIGPGKFSIDSKLSSHPF